MLRRLSLAAIIACCLGTAGCSESPPATLPPPSRVLSLELRMPPPPLAPPEESTEAAEPGASSESDELPAAPPAASERDPRLSSYKILAAPLPPVRPLGPEPDLVIPDNVALFGPEFRRFEPPSPTLLN